MVKHPAEYKWSSFRCNAMGESSELIIPQFVYQSLDFQKDSRVNKYLNLFDSEIVKQDLEFIRKSVLFSVPTGDNRFKNKIEKITGCRVGNTKRGRPLKEVV